MGTHARLPVVLLFVATVGCSTDFSRFPAIALVPQSPAQTEVYATYLSPIALAADSSR